MGKEMVPTFYPEAEFGGFSEVDGTVRFYTRVNALMQPGFVVLDVGCGRGVYVKDPVSYRRKLRVFKGRCSRVIGIDVDPTARENPCLDEFRVIEQDKWPVESESVDLCVSDYVLEHITSPDDFFSECARVVRTGGFLCIRTPNAWSYESLAARLMPNRWRNSLLKTLPTRREEKDVFPTAYRCSTPGRIASAMRRHGFASCVFTHCAEPSYLGFSKALYYLGTIYHRIAPRFVRSNVFAFGQKTRAS